jgi:hypothetical protein
MLLLCHAPAPAGELSFGAKAGFGLSNLTGTPGYWESYKDYKTGFNGGLVLLYEFSDQLALQPELLYSQRGVQSNLYEGIILVDVTASFDYVELPVLVRYQFPLQGKFKPHVFAGPSISYNLNSELEFKASVVSVSADIGSVTQVSDFGLVAGGGFGYDTGRGVVTLDARVYYGFTNVLLTGDFEINGSTHTIEEDDFKTYSFVFLLGFII